MTFRQRLSISRRSLLGGAAGLVTAVLLPWESQAGAATKPTPSGQVVLGISQEPTAFDPRLPHIEVDQGVYQAIFSPLWTVDPSGKMLPRLALEVPTVENGGLSPDGLTWSIKLRPGVKWHDGTPFTADDVKFSIESVCQPNFPAYSTIGHNLVEDIRVTSPTSLTWKMKTLFAPYISILSWFMIVPSHLLKGVAPLGSPFQRNPVGTGPFKWKERVPGDHITVVANEDYFDAGPLIETAVFKYVPDLTVLYTQFRTGGIDYIGLQGISADHYAEARRLPNRVVLAAPQASIENFYFNLGRPQFREKAVRQAIYLAYDKDSIIKEIYYGVPHPSETYLPKESWAFNPDLPKHVFDIDKANEMLDRAGWKKGAGGIREKGGVKLAFSNSTTAGNHLREQTQQFLQQTFRQIGVDMEIKNLPPAVMWGKYWQMSEFDTAMVGIDFMTGPDPDASIYFSSQSIATKTGAGYNTMQYSNPVVDKLLVDGAAELDRAKRVPIYQRLQAVLREDLPFLVQQQYVEIEGTKTNLKGYEPNINVLLNDWNLETWHWV